MLSVIKDKFKDKYYDLSDREQLLVSVAIGCIIIFGLYLCLKNMHFILQPSYKGVLTSRESEFNKIKSQLAELKKLQAIKTNYQTIDDDDIYKLINDNPPKLAVLNREKIKLSEIKNRVEIQYRAVSFDDLVNWLEKLQKQYGISVARANISAVAEKEGYVSVDIVLH